MTALIDPDVDDIRDREDREAEDREAMRVAAQQKARQRARKRRDQLANRVDVLDELRVGQVELLAKAPTIADVAAFFGINAGSLGRLLRWYRDEFIEDGWTAASRCDDDLWTDEAVVRAALLLDGVQSAAAAEIRYLLGVDGLPVAFSSRDYRIQQCEKVFERAMAVVGDVHGESSPVAVWRELQQMPRYELQALAVALASLVPDDVPGLGEYLRELAGKRDSIAAGLALLIPQRSPLFARRRSRGRGRGRSFAEPGGVAVCAQR
ncbi:hypothetical protein [Mycobacterium intracellulare]|uniref:hypothetical protein n=1 Tax=Mycobacterium intracellulare TaxID=1767 RepID=UPI000BAC240B|nr:hypothetical protein [Mycobacterium intracellulare]ASX03565.1 hypothetical protein CKJ58_26470 [Mycobacterium intracellulare subsp. chimaera]PBA61348.1 hypothetical protein CKJ56_13440 [Mycobacterium intracellulare subsp. chimaera]